MLNKRGLALVLACLTVLGGCATTDYKTHYGIFKAETSDGTIRDFRVYWQSIRYEGWGEDTYRVTPITMETQCSQRKLYFYDITHGNSRNCVDPNEEGIYSCGSAGKDFDPKGLAITQTGFCGYITDDYDVKRIDELSERIQITFRCRPQRIEVKRGAELINVDYIRASAVPYTITTKTIRGSSIEKLVPPLNNHSSICEN